MSSHTERVWEDALQLGKANQVTVELARRHCLNMIFTECGGQGMAEEATGLPINMREVSCLVARGNQAMNLDLIASDFYKAYCVGCTHRRPTGWMPNLATVMEGHAAQAATAAEMERLVTEQRHREWARRVDGRRALVAGADPAMVGALDDMGVLDCEPGVEPDLDASGGATRRLAALAERAPDRFTTDVIGLAIELVEQVHVIDLLVPLRHLARARHEVAPVVLAAALTTLRRTAAVEAGRCVADLLGAGDTESVDHASVRSLVVLAGAPQDGLLGRGSSRTNANDPGGLRKAAGIAPGIVVAVLRDFLPSPTGSSKLVLPLGAGVCPSPGGVGDYQRTSAAGAIRSLAATHAGIVAQLVEPLIRNLGVSEDDQYGVYPVGNVQRALATLLVLDIGDVANRLDAAGRSASNDVRERLFGVLEMTVRLLDPGDRFREPGDPHPGDDRRHALLDRLVHVCLTRVGGDWGDDVRYSAAKLVEELAEVEPAWTFSHLDAILGTFLTTVEQVDKEPTPSLTVLDATSPQLRALESFSRRNSIGSAARELLSAVEHVADVDVLVVCTVIITLIIDERDADRGAETVWRLLPLLGKIGKRHGVIPGLLQQILPTLHTHILDTDPSLRSAALQAWEEIGSSHQLPSSLTDLLPALLTDNYYSVIRAVLTAARRLTWNDQSHAQLLVYAIQICASVDAKDHADVLKSAMYTVDFLTRGNDQARAYAEKLILQRAADLDRYDLRDALRRSWSQETKQTIDMAVLRLRQARDPHINDRFNQRDDQQLCELLDCGPGFIALPTEDLIAAALDLAPNHPIGSAEFAEVAWRAGRPSDAATIMCAVIDATPRTPAYEQARTFATLLAQAAIFDAAAAAGDNLDDAAAALEVTIAAHKANTGGDRQAIRLRQIRARTTAHFLLAGKETPENLVYSPDGIDSTHGRGHAAARRARADHLALVAVELTALSQRSTATGGYLRSFANLCEIAAHLLRFDAAELEADIEAANAQRTLIPTGRSN